MIRAMLRRRSADRLVNRAAWMVKRASSASQKRLPTCSSVNRPGVSCWVSMSRWRRLGDRTTESSRCVRAPASSASNRALGLATSSRCTGMSDTSTGERQAIPSMTGIEKPSAREAAIVARACRYQAASSSSATCSRKWRRARPPLIRAAWRTTRRRHASG